MLKFITVAAGCLLLQASLVEASECKGLAQDVCSANAICVWRAEMVAGETKTAKGEPHKRSAKAHCRLKPFTKDPAKQQAKAAN